MPKHANFEDQHINTSIEVPQLYINQLLMINIIRTIICRTVRPVVYLYNTYYDASLLAGYVLLLIYDVFKSGEHTCGNCTNQGVTAALPRPA